MKIPAIRTPSIQIHKKIVYTLISTGTSSVMTGTSAMASGGIAVLSWLTMGAGSGFIGSME